MVLDELRVRLERLLASQGPRAKAGLREALIELKAAAAQSREALAAAERERESQARQLADAERRGRLADEIGDQETARIAEEFSARHRERFELLTRKIGVIRDELAFVEREYRSAAAEYRDPGRPAPAPAGEAEPDERELRDLEYRADRAAIERAVQAQLESLKKRMGRT